MVEYELMSVADGEGADNEAVWEVETFGVKVDPDPEDGSLVGVVIWLDEPSVVLELVGCAMLVEEVEMASTSAVGMTLIRVTVHPGGASPSKTTWTTEPKTQKRAWRPANASLLQSNVLFVRMENTVESSANIGETSNLCEGTSPFVDT